MKAALYSRVSTADKQDINTQLVYLRAYASNNGLQVTKEYCDVGQSGSKESRPQFDVMLSDMRAGQFEGVLVYKLDRIGRSLSHLLKLFEEFGKRRISFVSATQNINTATPEGKLFLHLLMVMAEYERELTVSRIKDGVARARKEGKLGKRGRDKGQRRRSGYWQRWAGKKTTPKNVAVVPPLNSASK